MMRRYFSQVYIPELSENPEWFDPQMDLDTKLYVDPFLVFKSDIPLFKDAKTRFLDFFNSAFELAHEAVNSVTALKILEDILTFPEAAEICLGDSAKGVDGSGPGRKFAKACATALRSLASKGYRGLDHFEEIEIFTEGIGQDGISDATATILKKELIIYTQQICNQYNVETKSFPVKNINFDFTYLPDVWEDGHLSLPINPFPRRSKSGKDIYKGIILVPKKFLCINHSISSDGFAEYVKSKSPQELRNSLNYTIEKALGKEDKPKKKNKSIIVDIAQQNPNLVEDYVKSVEQNQDKIEPYDLEFDEKNLYRNQKKSHDFVLSNPLAISANNNDEFINAIELIINQFKIYVEDKTGYKLLWNDPTEDELGKKIEPKPRNEDTAQSLFSGIVFHYCQSNNIDLSRETNLGRGPVDFKFSSGYSSRALVELKLARSTKLEQGAIKQLPKYLQTEQIRYGYYVVILHTDKDIERLEKVRELIKATDFGSIVFKLFAIDATRDKPSASHL